MKIPQASRYETNDSGYSNYLKEIDNCQRPNTSAQSNDNTSTWIWGIGLAIAVAVLIFSD
jgi:hypothetical protein